MDPTPDNPTPTERVWLDRHEASKYLGVSVKTLSRWPVPVARVGRVVRYCRADLDAFLRSRQVTPPAAEWPALGTPPPVNRSRQSKAAKDDRPLLQQLKAIMGV